VEATQVFFGILSAMAATGVVAMLLCDGIEEIKRYRHRTKRR
jgi:hypothetical protein